MARTWAKVLALAGAAHHAIAHSPPPHQVSRPGPLLNPGDCCVPVPETPWSGIGIDLITDLPVIRRPG